MTFSHYWLIIITISSSQHVLIQPELRRPTREDRRVPADCRTLVQQTLGSRASAKERERRRSVVRFEGLPAAENTPTPPPRLSPLHLVFCMCSRICKNNLWEHLVLIPFLLISCCWMSNCWTKALVYIRTACNRMRLELLPLEFDMRS